MPPLNLIDLLALIDDIDMLRFFLSIRATCRKEFYFEKHFNRMFPVAMETTQICTEPVFYTHFTSVVAHVSSVLCVMGDLAADLNSFSFEAGLDEEGKESLHLRARFAGLTFCGCAHAVFLCKLAQSLR